MAYKLIVEKITEALGSLIGERNAEDLMFADITEKASIDKENRIVSVVVSSENVDRDGDIIIQKGIDHSFTKSVLYAHNYGYDSQLPIAKILSSEIKTKKGTKVTIEEHQFPEVGKNLFADTTFNMIDFGALNSTSIGFIPKSIVRPETDQDREKLGLGRYGRLYKQVEKLETSWVPVPSNRDAIREMYGKGLIDSVNASLIIPDTWRDIKAPDSWAVGIDFEEKKEPEIDKDTIETLQNFMIQNFVDVMENYIDDNFKAITDRLTVLENKPEPDKLDEKTVLEAIQEIKETQSPVLDTEKLLEEFGTRISDRLKTGIKNIAKGALDFHTGKVDTSKLNFKKE